jgi:hypothetical protein
VTTTRKLCATCRKPVKLVRQVPLIFRCPTHGQRAWWEITHGEVVKPSGLDYTQDTTTQETTPWTLPLT